MANTIRASKNTFSGGLVMDLAPDTTPNEVLTSALNATLLTFNGNELSLQNDMGNGRVETARLPEGYIPVGTCEFGDIIYIVSYNPLTNKSQIGCFPSPERNISSEEIGSTDQTLSSSDFQEMDGSNLTGKLKTNSVKKIIYNNKLNPGDKFIIYDKNCQIHAEGHITDLSNPSHVYGSYPKWLRIHVVAIEDSGKINYLDSTLRWYDVSKPDKNYSYFINESKEVNGKSDIDTYRNKLSSGYSVFQSKVSGKLALLIELEKITGFSCTHTVYSKKGEEICDEEGNCITTTKFLTYINFNWETDNPNINPAAVILTNTRWVGKINQKDGENLAGKVLFWKKENNNVIKDTPNNKYQEVSYSGNTTATPHYNNDKYYEALIDGITSTNYQNFIEESSYDIKLKEKLQDIIKTYPGYTNDVLSKLNIEKADNDGYLKIPTSGKYYINAIGKSQEGKIQSKSSFTGKLFNIEAIEIPDYIVNNYFHYPVYKKFLEFTIPTNQKILIQDNTNSEQNNTKLKQDNIYLEMVPDITNMIYEYTVTPAMPYGLLDEYSITNYIDFSKIGSGTIDFHTWKYFVGENLLTLTLGLDTYVEDNMDISEIAIEFIDNQGVAAVYHISGKASYSGQFTEVIPLNGATTKNNLNAINNYRNNDLNYENGICIHCGPQIDQFQEGCLTLDGNTPRYATPEDKVFYLNDAGVIYQGMLYLAKITVKYCPKDSLDNLDDTDTTRFKVFNRWLWTTTMYNNQYYQVKDFNDLSLSLSYDIGPKYEMTNNYYWGKFKYISPETSVVGTSDDIYKYISAQVQIVTDRSEVSNNVINPDDSNNTDNPGENGEEKPAVLWSNWEITQMDNSLILTMMCTVEAEWDISKIVLQSLDGTTYAYRTNYDFILGENTVQLKIYNIIENADLILTRLPGFGSAKATGEISPYNKLNFKYIVNE